MPKFIRRIVDPIGKELAVTAGGAGVLAIWKLPISLLLPIAIMWFMTFVSLNFLHQAADPRPRGSKILVVALISSALVVTLVALGVSLFRNPDAVKMIEVEITSAIKDMNDAETHPVDCGDCPGKWKIGSQSVLITSAPISQTRKTVGLAPFIVEMSSGRTVSTLFWALAVFYALITIFVGFGSVMATLSARALGDANVPPQ